MIHRVFDLGLGVGKSRTRFLRFSPLQFEVWCYGPHGRFLRLFLVSYIRYLFTTSSRVPCTPPLEVLSVQYAIFRCFSPTVARPSAMMIPILLPNLELECKGDRFYGLSFYGYRVRLIIDHDTGLLVTT